jgi:ParB family transcriptional regulator, chromosome partitioning protein
MTLKKRGLGRGLEALLVNVSAKEEKHQLQTLPIDILQQGHYLSPNDISSDELQELADSIKASGTIEPVVVRKIVENNYEIVAGESRWRAARLAGLQEVPVIIRELDDQEPMAIALIETIHKENLNLLQEAEALRKLIDEFEALVRHFIYHEGHEDHEEK